MEDEITGWAFILVTAFISTPIAFILNNALHRKSPNLRPYAWGYFNGVIALLLGSLGFFVSAVLFFDSTGDERLGAYLYGGFSAIYVVLGIYVIKRNRWAWVPLIFFTFNPLAWIINGIYLKNRWHEMHEHTILPESTVRSITTINSSNSTVASPTFTQNIRPRASRLTRVSLASIAFWALLVVAFVLVFEPYGGRMSDSDWNHVIKVILFPPLVAVAGYFLFTKAIQGGK